MEAHHTINFSILFLLSSAVPENEFYEEFNFNSRPNDLSSVTSCSTSLGGTAGDGDCHEFDKKISTEHLNLFLQLQSNHLIAQRNSKRRESASSTLNPIDFETESCNLNKDEEEKEKRNRKPNHLTDLLLWVCQRLFELLCCWKQK